MSETTCRQPDAAAGELQPAPPQWRALGFVTAILLILVIHVLGRTGAFCSPIRADSYAYSSFGYRIAHGEVLYRDMHLDKPPGLMWLNAPVYLFAPAGRWPLIPLESLCMLLGYFSAYKVGRDLYGRVVGLVLAVATTLAVNLFLLVDYTVEGFNLAENYMVLTSSAAVLYYRRAYRTRHTYQFVRAGVFLGLGLTLKQTALPLIATIVLHHTVSDLIIRRRRGEWTLKTGALLAGMGVVLVPVGAVLASHGVLLRAVESMTVQASGMLTVTTAWPARWADVLPLWVPLAWCAIGLIGWSKEVFHGPSNHVGSASDHHPLPSIADVSFLLLWIALECVMLVYLPRRSFHYYALSSLPVIFLSGLLWAALRRELATTQARSAKLVMATAAIWSVAFARTAIDVVVPTAIARYRTYDAEADQAAFNDALTCNDVSVG